MDQRQQAGGDAQAAAVKAERLRRFAQIDLYPVTCEALSAGRTDEQVLDACVEGGASIIQLRDKHAAKQTLVAKAKRWREITSRHGLLLIVNDYVDIAVGVGADGVHLGQDDFPLVAARRLAPDMIIGVSTHNLAEAMAAQDSGADYVNIGPIFATRTKDGLSEFLGPDAIRQIAPRLDLPFTVMGGITLDNIDQVLAAGAAKVAVVTAITGAADITAAVRTLRTRILATANRAQAGPPSALESA